MTIPAMLVCLVFLILGASGDVKAQNSLTAIPQFTIENSEKIPFELLAGSEAVQIIRGEIQGTYQGPFPDQDTETNATFVYKRSFLIMIQNEILKGNPTVSSIYSAYNQMVKRTENVWPGLVNETWIDDAITLLSN